MTGLSTRDQLAFDFLPAVLSEYDLPATELVQKAFELADAFIEESHHLLEDKP